jgi:hypothetical protein
MELMLGDVGIFLGFTSVLSTMESLTYTYEAIPAEDRRKSKLDRELAREVSRRIVAGEFLSPSQVEYIPLILEDFSLKIEAEWTNLSVEKRNSLVSAAHKIIFKWRGRKAAPTSNAPGKSRRPSPRLMMRGAFCLGVSILRTSLVLRRNLLKDIESGCRVVANTILRQSNQDEELIREYLANFPPADSWLEYNLAAKASLERGLQQASQSEGRFIRSFAEFANLDVDD